MPDQPEDDTLSIQIANQIINVANARMQDGVDVAEIAQGLRHAAANFSAFAEFHAREGSPDPGRIVEDFIRFLEYYLGRHGESSEQAGEPGSGLEHLIQQVKDEL